MQGFVEQNTLKVNLKGHKMNEDHLKRIEDEFTTRKKQKQLQSNVNDIIRQVDLCDEIFPDDQLNDIEDHSALFKKQSHKALQYLRYRADPENNILVNLTKKIMIQYGLAFPFSNLKTIYKKDDFSILIAQVLNDKDQEVYGLKLFNNKYGVTMSKDTAQMLAYTNLKVLPVDDKKRNQPFPILKLGFSQVNLVVGQNLTIQDIDSILELDEGIKQIEKDDENHAEIMREATIESEKLRARQAKDLKDFMQRAGKSKIQVKREEEEN